ncbi:EAL domain-containing protein [Paucibacter sp. APW11]|uniref:EAL domain-containing protein n=1 Tax=Roseateles aquae TaxID=3077235 RepID=A0ABU3P7T6_9BURK|nr:EAL domain-containing protein [Paucibacter sp. APW11]MDT8998609.1 EAL domain-containing protein [Paucibacter sp. APW11]
MSLIRRLGLLVLAVVLVSLLGSVAVTTASVRQLLLTQLQVKNGDNAAALALALSQQRGDAELMSLLISAQFDTGHYQSVIWRRADGSVAFERHMDGRASEAPAWFIALTPIAVQAGVAQVSNGWNSAGSVELRSHSAYAHDELWQSTLRSGSLLLLLGLIGLLLAAWGLRKLRQPLDNAVAQAQALAEGQFTTVDEPTIPELQRLTRAMNTMVARIKSLFEAQAGQLKVLQQQAHCDALTGLSQRKHFLAELESVLTRDDGPARAGLVLLRLRDLPGLNQRMGHQQVDQILQAIARAVKVYPDRVRGCLAGRLNGSDFALWLPAPGVAADTAHALAEALRSGLAPLGQGLQVAISAVELPRQRTLSQWFGEADAVLARAEQGSGVVVEAFAAPVSDWQAHGERVWRRQIQEAVLQNRARLVEFPLVDREGKLLHLECPLQLQLDPQGGFQPASEWLPLALRSRLSGDADAQAVALALQAIAADGRPRCVNLAPASLLEGGFLARLRELVFQSPQAARKLGLELAEAAAIQHFELLHELGRQLRPLGVQLGLEHAGAGLAQVDRLFQAGLDYVKLDASVVSGLADEAARVAFVRGMVIMLRSLNVRVYAEGIKDPQDAQALWDCDLDGITGPWATSQLIKP